MTRAGALPWIPNSYQWSLTGSLIGKRPVKNGGRRLMPQNQDFGFQPSSRLEAVAQHTDDKNGNCNHSAIMF